MLKDMLSKLRNQNGTCISVILPTERGFQDLKRTDAELKLAFGEVESRLIEKGGKRFAQPFIEKLEMLSKDWDFADSKDGVGFFVNESVAERFDFPFPVNKMVVVDQSFQIRDLLFALNRLEEYYVMILAKEDARLYYGLGTTLTEISDRRGAKVPEEVLVYEEPTHGAWDYKKHRTDQNDYHWFLNQLDKVLTNYLNKRRLPVILLGDKESINYFENHSDSQRDIKAKMQFNFRNQRLSEIAEFIQHEVQKLGWDRAATVKVELEEAIGQNRFAAGIQSIWQAAAQGRIHRLIVERGFARPGYLSPDGYEIRFEERQDGSVLLNDVVDDLIEKVLDQNGEVYFIQPGELEPYQQIAAILRF